MCQNIHKAVRDSRGRLCSQRKAPRPASVSAQKLRSEKLGGTALFPEASPGQSGIAACSENRGRTLSPSQLHLGTSGGEYFGCNVWPFTLFLKWPMNTHGLLSDHKFCLFCAQWCTCRVFQFLMDTVNTGDTAIVVLPHHSHLANHTFYCGAAWQQASSSPNLALRRPCDYCASVLYSQSGSWRQTPLVLPVKHTAIQWWIKKQNCWNCAFSHIEDEWILMLRTGWADEATWPPSWEKKVILIMNIPSAWLIGESGISSISEIW